MPPEQNQEKQTKKQEFTPNQVKVFDMYKRFYNKPHPMDTRKSSKELYDEAMADLKYKKAEGTLTEADSAKAIRYGVLDPPPEVEPEKPEKLSDSAKSQMRIQLQKFLPSDAIDPKTQYKGSPMAVTDSMRVGLKPKVQAPKQPTPKAKTSKLQQKMSNLETRIKTLKGQPQNIVSDEQIKGDINLYIKLSSVQDKMILMEEQDQRAVEWAIENLNDQRAREILRRNGIKEFDEPEPEADEDGTVAKILKKLGFD